MCEGKGCLRALRARDAHSHLLRLLDDGKKFVNVDLADGSEKFKAEAAPDHGGSCQHPHFVRVEPLQSPADDQPHVFRNIALVDLDVSAELPGRIKDSSFLDQVPIHLLNEEWISLAFLKDVVHQTLWSSAPA